MSTTRHSIVRLSFGSAAPQPAPESQDHISEKSAPHLSEKSTTPTPPEEDEDDDDEEYGAEAYPVVVSVSFEPQTALDSIEQVEKPVKTTPVLDEKDSDPYQVVLDPEDDPKNLPLYIKWIIVLITAISATCVNCASSMSAFTEPAVMKEFHISQLVATLAISLFVAGIGIGPLLIGPLSEVVGRNLIYQASFLTFFIFSWPVAFAPNTAVYLVFRFITGLCGSAFLSVGAASVSDLFVNAQVATPMAVYSFGPSAGPIVGPIISGFINQHINWRWTYRLLIIWSFVLCIVLLCMPETYAPVLLKRKAERKRKSTGDNNYWAPIERENRSLAQATLVSCYRPFQLLLFDRMVLLLDLWNALVLGIVYLAFEAYPVIFGKGHGFNVQSIGLSFLGIGLGMVITVATSPLRNKMAARTAAKHGGRPPPEAALVPAQIAAVLLPIGLFWMAFTTYPSVHWIVPIIASIPFGMGAILALISTFTYLVIAYRPIAASALASNAFLRCLFSAVFPLFAPAMYNRLGTVGATALLAGLTTVMAPLPFIFHRIGARLRENSKFAVK